MKIGAYEAKSHFSALLDRVEKESAYRLHGTDASWRRSHPLPVRPTERWRRPSLRS